MFKNALRSSEFWTSVVAVVGSVARPIVPLDDETWRTVQVFAASYLVARVGGKVAKANIK